MGWGLGYSNGMELLTVLINGNKTQKDTEKCVHANKHINTFRLTSGNFTIRE